MSIEFPDFNKIFEQVAKKINGEWEYIEILNANRLQKFLNENKIQNQIVVYIEKKPYLFFVRIKNGS